MSLLENLKRPLDFASKNNFANFARVKGLGATLGRLLETLPAELLNETARAALRAELEGFDGCPEAERRARAARMKLLLEHPERLPAVRRAARPTKKRDERVATETIKRGPLDDLPLAKVTGVGPKTAARLSARGLDSVHDALLYLPRGYEDRGHTTEIAAVVPGRSALVEGTVVHSQVSRAGRRRLFEAVISDGTGTLSCRWFRFHPKAMATRLERGASVRLYGPITTWGAMRQMVHPEIEGARATPSGLLPIYPEIDGVPPKNLRQLLQRVARDHAAQVPDPMPTALRQRLGFPPLGLALERAHLPQTADRARGAPDRTVIERLIFDELLYLELALLQRKQTSSKESGLAHRGVRPWPELAAELFRFELTDDQAQACAEIVADLERPAPMNRLLQGDVGSGKTAVALLAAAWVKDSGRQSVILAPTEILATQHLATARDALGSQGLSVELLVGGMKGRDRSALLERLKTKEIDVLIGTHAVLEPDVWCGALGLLVIDEQHRFGVEQRARLRSKAGGLAPDVLVMTATPIPRTLALTAFGDLDLSVIRHRPKGRGPVSTRVYREEDRKDAYLVVEATLSRGEQVYVIFPLVESSELAADLKAATRAVSGLERRFPSHRVGLLHGRMSSEEKATVMQAFRSGAVQLLVSTTVVEVGVDVPNATVLVLENAERFGLSQVHQLRGRVGRGDKPGRCLLIADGAGREAWERLMILESTEDGFAIAEADLRFRGPGEILGTRQSGLPLLMMADLSKDGAVLERAREVALELLGKDPTLSSEENGALKLELDRRRSGSLRLADVG